MSYTEALQKSLIGTMFADESLNDRTRSEASIVVSGAIRDQHLIAPELNSEAKKYIVENLAKLLIELANSTDATPESIIAEIIEEGKLGPELIASVGARIYDVR